MIIIALEHIAAAGASVWALASDFFSFYYVHVLGEYGVTIATFIAAFATAFMAYQAWRARYQWRDQFYFEKRMAFANSFDRTMSKTEKARMSYVTAVKSVSFSLNSMNRMSELKRIKEAGELYGKYLHELITLLRAHRHYPFFTVEVIKAAYETLEYYESVIELCLLQIEPRTPSLFDDTHNATKRSLETVQDVLDCNLYKSKAISRFREAVSRHY